MQGCYPAFQSAGWMPSSSMRASVQCLGGIIANDPAEAVYFNIEKSSSEGQAESAALAHRTEAANGLLWRFRNLLARATGGQR
jgi:hypothetical protein